MQDWIIHNFGPYSKALLRFARHQENQIRDKLQEPPRGIPVHRSYIFLLHNWNKCRADIQISNQIFWILYESWSSNLVTLASPGWLACLLACMHADKAQVIKALILLVSIKNPSFGALKALTDKTESRNKTVQETKPCPALPRTQGVINFLFLEFFFQALPTRFCHRICDRVVQNAQPCHRETPPCCFNI
jgi:hypothetical protein